MTSKTQKDPHTVKVDTDKHITCIVDIQCLKTINTLKKQPKEGWRAKNGA